MRALTVQNLGRVLVTGMLVLGVGGCSSLNPFSDDEAEAVSSQGVRAEAPVVKPVVSSKVNGHLWEAALETVAFMPIEEASEQIGLIRTGWYVPPSSPTERFRLDVVFSARSLRPESFHVNILRQELRNGTSWVDLPPTPAVQRNLENTILFRAVQLRQESGLL